MGKMDEQLALEEKANDYSYDRLAKEISNRTRSGQADELGEGRFILIHSIEKVADKIQEYFDAPLRGKQAMARGLLQESFNNKPKDLAYVTIVSIVRSVSADLHIPTTQLIRNINKNVYDSILVQRLNEAENNQSAYIDKRYKNRSLKYRREQKIKIASRQDDLSSNDLTTLTTYVGAILLDLVIKSGVNIIESRLVYKNKKAKSHITYTEQCFKMILQSRERLLNEYRKFPIFVVKPKDWACFSGSGGYFSTQLYKVPLIKARPSARALLEEYIGKGSNTTIYEVLNTLQATSWRVNKRVLEVMDRVFQDNIKDPASPFEDPYLLGRLAYNQQLEPEDFINIHSYGKLWEDGKYKGLPIEKDSMLKYFRDIEDQRDLIISNTGKAIMLNYVLSDAKNYEDEENIYFSYQYDFRGRIYPIQPHLQPQGKSEVKALLEFSTGYKIDTDEELFWFMVHGANCYGYDKLEYEDRVSNMTTKAEDVLNITANPLKYQEYWKDTDEPYLYLAWCFEYAEYLKDPINFESHIPISLDATCSGIQIYSGLLLDEEGASAVNVIGDKRKDIYQQVATKVNEYISKGEYVKEFVYKTSDKQEHTVSTQHIADSFKGKVTRRLTKRNTMTQPYSVTRFGMYEQLKEELASLEKENKKFWVGENWEAAKFLTDLNDKAITETVKGARLGQEYLKEVTREKVKQGGWVFYTTPLTGFPVLQKIHKTSVDRISTPVGFLSIRKALEDINPAKMVNGIAPN